MLVAHSSAIRGDAQGITDTETYLVGCTSRQSQAGRSADHPAMSSTIKGFGNWSGKEELEHGKPFLAYETAAMRKKRHDQIPAGGKLANIA